MCTLGKQEIYLQDDTGSFPNSCNTVTHHWTHFAKRRWTLTVTMLQQSRVPHASSCDRQLFDCVPVSSWAQWRTKSRLMDESGQPTYLLRGGQPPNQPPLTSRSRTHPNLAPSLGLNLHMASITTTTDLNVKRANLGKKSLTVRLIQYRLAQAKLLS